MKILFLDIDGVLNDHGMIMDIYCGIHLDKVKRLNKILNDTGCYIVISSAWRYMILGGDMTIKGFEHLLVSHGVNCCQRIIGHTPSDNDVDTRGKQITDWINNGLPPILSKLKTSCFKYVVVDDLDKEIDIQISEAGHPLVQTNGDIGLTDSDVERIISMLNS